MNIEEKIKIQEMVNENTEIGIFQQKFSCACGCKISLAGIERHLLTEKHITNLKARKFEKLIEKKIIVF
tara:strand:+ start:331 stop:537 length:207 start_codon:yes stop_codon:yes gene_type:complete